MSTIKIKSISDINKAVAENVQGFVAEGEAVYTNELTDAAERILGTSEKHPVVLVSGPSGSGKTTSALRVEKLLRDRGCAAHTISMDNYFLPKSHHVDIPTNDDGTPDLESPYRLDISLLQEHLDRLHNCKEIEIPIFNFKTNERDGVIPVKRKEGEVIIVEGIHALNPIVTGDSRDYATCIYVSVRTRLENSEADRLHPRLIRLMRRLSRDKLFRGRAMQDTFKMFKSVSRGEEAHIMPHKHLADFDIDTFIEFEPSVYKSVIYDSLLEISQDMSGDFDYDMIRAFLSEVDPIDKSVIPADSLIREFVGD